MRKRNGRTNTKFNEPSSDRSSRFNPPTPPSGRNPSAYKKPKSGIDPDAFSDDTSHRYNPRPKSNVKAR